MKIIKKVTILVLLSVWSGIYIWNFFDLNTLFGNMRDAYVKKETILNQESAIFEGVQEFSGTPWNINAGKILMEDETTCLFLTPNTSVEVALEENVCFSYRIHHWVSASSDGAGLMVWLLDEQNGILYEEEIFVDAEANWEKYKLNLENYPEAKKVKILCNNGKADDDSCDWVIIK